MKRILLSTLLVLTMISSVLADEISFVASAPKSVEVGKRFQITYKINTKTDGEPTLQEFDGLEILMGPSVSTASSMQYINGRRTDSFEITYTYIVKLHKEGNITIPGASVMVGGKEYISNQLIINVLPEEKTLSSIKQIPTVADEKVSFIASAPKSVEVGKRFQITYKINTKTDGKPTLQEFDGLEILMGPSVSTASSMQYINGRRIDSFEKTYTYIVRLHKEGNITIPGASVMADGKKYTSNPVTIKVLPEGQPLPQSQQNADPTKIPDDRLFIRAEVNKTKVYEQEALLLTYKVYSADVDLRDLDKHTPKFSGCKIHEVELPQSCQFELEHYKGQNYNTFVWQQFVLFPQQTGKLEIPAMDYEAVVAVQTRQAMDPFEMMFNGMPSYVEVRKKLKSNKIVIDVEKLPAGKPADFSGAVGNFTINSTISTDKLKSNEEFTLKVTVKGDGNMKLMGDPVVDFPSEFDVEKIDQYIDRNRLTDKGFVGEREYQYILTPRKAGMYTIPAVKFIYFDTKTGKYKTVESKEHYVEVEKVLTDEAELKEWMYMNW